MNRTKNEYIGAAMNFTQCYSGYQQYGAIAPCRCLEILNPTPATVIPDIMRGVKPHDMPNKNHNPIECSGCFKNRFATSKENADCYSMKKSCECSTNI